VSGGFNPELSLWDIFSQQPLRVGVVNWWFTWPATKVSDFLVSDRAYAKVVASLGPDGRPPSAPIPFGLETYPKPLLQECVAAARAPESIDVAEVAPRVSGSDEAARAIRTALQESIGVDSFAARFAAGKLREASAGGRPFDFLALQLYGLDALRNRLAEAGALAAAPLDLQASGAE